MYFLGAKEYLYYRDLHGPVLGNFFFVGKWGSGGEGFGSMASEPPLMLCGYSVGRVDGLMSKQRHLILSNVMDRGILDKPRVIEYLQFFINSRKGRRGMGAACAKWQEDLAWVRSYRIDRQRHFTVAEVRRFW